MYKIKLTAHNVFASGKLLPFFLTIAILVFHTTVRSYHHFYIGTSVAKWRTFPVNFIVDNDSAAFQMQVNTAFTTWNGITTAKDILGARTNSPIDFKGSNYMMAWGNLTADGQQELVFDADGTAISQAGYDPHTINGYGPTRKESDGTITDAYFIINGSGLSGVFDRPSTIVHELGHIQGLAHSAVGMHNSGSFPSEALKPININSVPTMHPFPISGTARQTPEADDIAGLSELYPEASFETSFSTIEGKVTRCFASSTTPVIGAQVRVVNKNSNNIQLSRFTSFDGNSDGRYTIKGVPPGTYQIIVEPMGANDFTIGRFKMMGQPLGPSTFETDFATEYLSAETDENTCPEEIPDMPTDLMATAGNTLSDKDLKVQNIKLALVIDDTGSMTEEIAGVRTGMSNAIVRFQQISQQTGEPFPDVAIITFKDSVTTRLISNNPTRLQSIISGITATGGDDCPESSNAALQTAGRFLRNRGEAVLATDADSRPDGPHRTTVETQYRAKSLKLSTLLSGICPNSLTTGEEENSFNAEQNCSIFQSSSNLEEYQPPLTLGVEQSVRTYSELATETGGLFVYLPGVNSSSAIEKQRYANIAANLFVSSVVPAVGLVSPGDGIRGRTMNVEINGLTTNFQSSSQVSFGNGVTVNSRIVDSPEKITVNITVASDAASGFRDVTVTTSLGSGIIETATGVGAFNISDPSPSAKLISITPTQGAQGNTLNVEIFGSNTHFVNGMSAAGFGAGIAVNSTTVISSTQAVVSITIQSSAAIGLRDVTVTTGSEVAVEDLPGPFLVTGPSAVIPRITAVNPSQGQRGQTLNISITGENTNFVNGTSVVSFSGTGMTVNSTTVSSPTSAVVNITIAPDAALTFRDVILTTGGEIATALGAFQVTVGTSPPRIIGINPTQGNRGQTLNITVTGENTNFVNGTSVAGFSGGGITVNSTTISSPASAVVNITIAANAALTLRDITITTGSEIVTATGVFRILNRPPICLGARPSVALITPPNRNFVPVSILDVVDPDNDPVSIMITTVRQDEPIDHIGDGSFVPDSIINGSTVMLRAESILGTVIVGGTTFVGNGRFYHVNYTAFDTSNDSCTGTVKVAVPHTVTATPIDGGPLFNSASAQPARFSDFDGDRKSDFSVFRRGEWYINNTLNGQVRVVNFGLPDDKIVPADFDGDGRTDIAVFRNGDWYMMGSTAGFTTGHFGQAGDIPVPADYDGDGKDDVAVFRQGIWYLQQSSRGFTAVQFGLGSDKPVAADYDGDGKTDIAVFREGTWYLLRSSQGFSAVQFGLANDKAIPSDYDGDGKADIGVFRNGIWYISRSSQGFAAIQFGIASDIPTPADYDKDGKADIGVFRDGYWYTLSSSNGQFSAVRFGEPDDKPIPSAFVP
jgi:hypothetical protein